MELHRPQNIERWVPSNPVAAFWDISSHVSSHSFLVIPVEDSDFLVRLQVLIDLADVLIEKKSIKLNDLRQYINLFKEILAFRNEFLAKHKDGRSDQAEGTSSASSGGSLHSTAATRVEVALLIQLCSGYVEAGQDSELSRPLPFPFCVITARLRSLLKLRIAWGCSATK